MYFVSSMQFFLGFSSNSSLQVQFGFLSKSIVNFDFELCTLSILCLWICILCEIYCFSIMFLKRGLLIRGSFYKLILFLFTHIYINNTQQHMYNYFQDFNEPFIIQSPFSYIIFSQRIYHDPQEQSILRQRHLQHASYFDQEPFPRSGLKKNRKQSLSLVEPTKLSMINNDNKKTSKDMDHSLTNTLPKAIAQSDKCVPEYFTEIFKYIRGKQTSVIGNYCEKTINIDQNLRGQIINWLMQVHLSFKLFPQTLYFVIYYMDKYLAQRNIQRSKLKLIAISCLYMASKYEETYHVPQMKELLNLCNYSYTKRQILETQADIIKLLKFDLVFDSSYKFLEGLEVFSGMNKKNFFLAQYLLELALTQCEFLEYSQSLLACSAFYLVCKIRKLQVDWDDKYQNLTGYKQTDLHKCARELCNLLQRIDMLRNVSFLKQKFSEPEFHEVTRLKLERKK